MVAFLMVFIAYGSGALPFSVWVGKVLLGVDVRRFGDGNPGATNAFRSGNRMAGLLALMLDVSKAAAPVGLAYFTLGLRGVIMFLIAMAPILGHVFSPFLGFRGGKGLATALGVWIGLTLWKASLPALVGVLIGSAMFVLPGWAVLFALTVILLALLAWLPDPLLLAVWCGQSLVLAWTHRQELGQGIRLRPWVKHLFRRPKS